MSACAERVYFLRMNRIRVIVTVSAVLLLAGCSSSIDLSDAVLVSDGGPATVTAAELAIAAEGVVLEQGFVVDIDCGTDTLPLAVGTTLECAGLDPATGATGTYTLTITSVDGADYVLNVVGSDAPSADAVFESGEAFAALTAQAITASLGEEPFVNCGADDIEIFVGQEVLCAYQTSTANGYVVSTVTSLDGTTYEISVVEE